MNIERLRKIIRYSSANRQEMDEKIRDFYSFAGMTSNKELLNIMQIARSAFEKKKYFVFEIPFADKEIGALSYQGDSIGYIVLNTSLPKVNGNFAICHELYHVLYQKSRCKTKVEFVSDQYYEHEEEFAANLFASMLLMPESSFRSMYSKFKEESCGNEKDTIIRLMNYYQVPYMAVLIRCCELELPGMDSVSEDLSDMDRENIRRRFVELWLDDSILDSTKKDDYMHMKALVEHFGEIYIRESYLNERTLRKVLQNMQLLYEEMRG